MTQLEVIRDQIDDLSGRAYGVAYISETLRMNLQDLYYKFDVINDFWQELTAAVMKGNMSIDDAYDCAVNEPLIDFNDFAKEFTERGVDVSDVEWL